MHNLYNYIYKKRKEFIYFILFFIKKKINYFFYFAKCSSIFFRFNNLVLSLGLNGMAFSNSSFTL